LDGAPGIHSARYAGVDGDEQDAANRAKLLEAMREIPETKRSARFVCALAYVQPEEDPCIFEGTFEGSIGYKERGQNGFGYDPIFIVAGDTRTSAELTPEAKNKLSHRGKALRAFLNYITSQA